MSTTRSLFLLALCGLVGSSAQPSSRLAPEPAGRRAMPHGARIALAVEARAADSASQREGGVASARVSSAVPSSTRGTENARARLARLLREAPEPDLRALGGAGETLLAFLPLDRLRDARRTERELVLAFDTSADDTIEVVVPERRLQVLDADDDELDPELRGRARSLRTDEHVLLVHEELHFTLDAQGIAGVREGDLEVRAGPFAVDLALRTESRAGVARDRYGRPLLVVDEHGAPLRRDGRWVVQRYERWIVLEALGHRVEVGVP